MVREPLILSSQYHYIIQCDEHKIRNWYSHRRFLNGCVKCVGKLSAYCECGFRINCKPIADINHLSNTINYLAAKRDLATCGPFADPTREVEYNPPNMVRGIFVPGVDVHGSSNPGNTGRTSQSCSMAEIAKAVREQQEGSNGTVLPSATHGPTTSVRRTAVTVAQAQGWVTPTGSPPPKRTFSHISRQCTDENATTDPEGSDLGGWEELEIPVDMVVTVSGRLGPS